MQRKIEFQNGVGASSVLMVVVSLLLVAFSVLSFVSAQSEKDLTDTSIESIKQYYSAEYEAQLLLSKIDHVLSTSSFEESISELRSLSDDIFLSVDRVILFIVPINADKQLQIILYPTEINEDINGYRIYSHKTINTGSWDPEVDLNVWEGQ